MPALAALFQSGKELHISGTHAPRDASGYYVSPDDGARLTIDPGYAVGATLGTKVVYNSSTTGIVGTWADDRRNGWTAFTDAKYLTEPTPGGATTVLGHATPAATPTSDALFDGATTTDRFGVNVNGSTEWAVFQRVAPAAGQAVSTGVNATTRGETIVGATIDVSGNVAIGLYDKGDGTEDHYSTGTLSAPTHTDMLVGKNPNGGGLGWGGTVHSFLIWKGQALSQAALQAAAADLASGMGIAEVAERHGASVGSDGFGYGVADAANPTTGFTISGAGDEVVVAQPIAAQQYATHWRQASASAAEFLTATDASYPAAGTIAVLIDPTAIDAGGAVLLSLAGTVTIALELTPGSPDTLDASIGATSTSIAYTSDAALYGGGWKLAWLRWTSGGTMECGWGDPAGGLTDSTALGAVAADATATAIIARAIAGEHLAAAWARSLSDAELAAITTPATLKAAAEGDAYMLPQPAAAVWDGDILDTPASEVADETAHTWTIDTTDGTSAAQASR